jgi:hypothetical protein
VTSLGELSGVWPDWSEAYGLNDLGQVVGITLVAVPPEDTSQHGFIWLPTPMEDWELDQGMHDVGVLGENPLSHSVARDINDAGQLTGTSTGRAFVWFPEEVGEFPVQESWPLPELVPGNGGHGWALTDADGVPLRVVGWGVKDGCERGFLWSSNTPDYVVEVGPPSSPDWEADRLYAINPTVVESGFLGGVAHYCGQDDPQNHYGAIGQDMSSPYGMQNLPLPGPFGGPYAQARDVTDEGEFVGWAKDAEFENRDRALYWESVTADPANLHTETGIDDGHETRAEAIARPGGLPHVVGWNGFTNHALLWKRDSQGQWSVEDLNALIGSQARDDWELVEAHDINNGTSIPGWGEFPTPWIVGWGWYKPPHNPDEGDRRAFLLSTAKECPQDLDFDGEIGTSDLLILLENWDYCLEGEICWSDIDMDGDVDTADLLELLGHWGECGIGGGHIPRNVQDCIDRFGFGEPEALEACIQAVTGELD